MVVENRIALRGDINFVIRRLLFRYRLVRRAKIEFEMARMTGINGFWRDVPVEEH
jgi:hypothetical protein